MATNPVSLDTSPEMQQRQIDGLRRMSPADKLRLTAQMSMTVRDLALAGVRQRFPAASRREQFLRLAIVVLGDDLARRVYPEIEALDGS